MRRLLSACRRVARSCAWTRLGISVLLLIGLSGTHWWVLQSMAWTGMIVSYSAKSGLAKGVEETFDGAHPCPMCKAIKQARDSESQTSGALAPAQESLKLLGLATETSFTIARIAFPHPASLPFKAERRSWRPPLPPPRTDLA